MFVLNYGISFGAVGLCLCVIFPNTLAACNPQDCPGPQYYYKEIGCTPIFDEPDDCCPTRYHCDHWKSLPEDQCWVEGRVYNHSERIPTQLLSGYQCADCHCQGNVVSWEPITCPRKTPSPGCHHVSSLLSCCTEYEICADSPSVCNVDGKSYKIGEIFKPADEPKKSCHCLEGYDGVNDERFCVWRRPAWCRNVMLRIGDIRNNCAPTYIGEASGDNDECNFSFYCPEEGNYEIETKTNDDPLRPHSAEISGKHCKLGHLTLNIGDQLHASHHWGATVNCTCEVPPVPTCYENPVPMCHDMSP